MPAQSLLPTSIGIIAESSSRGWLAMVWDESLSSYTRVSAWHDLRMRLPRIASLGATSVLHLPDIEDLEPERVAALRTDAERLELNALQLKFEFDEAPSSIEETLDVIDRLIERLNRGERVALSAAESLHRAELVTACVFLRLGVEQSVRLAIENALGLRMRLENQLSRRQSEFINAFADHLRAADTTGDSEHSLDDSIKGAWLGLLAGALLGRGRANSWRPIAGWTGAPSLAQCNVAAYRREVFDVYAVASELVQWRTCGPTNVDPHTAAAIEALERPRVAPEQASWAGRMTSSVPAGTGSLMRAAATGIVRKWDDERLIEESRRLSIITHRDEECSDACVVFNLVLSSLVRGATTERALHRCQLLTEKLGPAAALVVTQLREGSHSLYADDADRSSSLHCLEWSLTTARDSRSFEEGVLATIERGGDVPTNTALAGALLGARFGIRGIPPDWVAELVDVDWISAALSTLQAAAKR